MEEEDITLILDGVRAFRAMDVLEGNIVFAIYVVSGRPLPNDIGLDEVDPPPHPAAESKYHYEHLERRERLVADIESRKLTLVWMDSSYGARFDVVCRKVTIAGA